MLEITSINKSYKSLKAVDELSLKFSHGKIYGLLGPNGAGKTTTIRIILNIIKADSGEIRYNGNSTDESFQNIVGYLPEERGLYKKSKVKDILSYFAKLKGLPSNRVSEKIDYWLTRLEIEKYKNSKLETLSKGNQQKVQFITSIIHDPKILILDEPFSGFDPMNQQTVKDVLHEFIKEGKIIIISTHLMEVAETLCSEIVLINKGKLLISENLSVLKSNESDGLFEVHFEEVIESNITAINFEIIENLNKKILLKKNRNLSNAILINELNNFGNIISFKKVVPTLNEIFMNMVKGTEN
ncbi:MAG: ATP-binding cassette domain-containing protein [Melioribacteraceae bacterium]|nr:ATP-binding cassette domain-containing protein [Melioribacteraceae bacterium]